MKKLLLVLVSLAGLCISAAAQDIIHTKDGRTIEARITNVGTQDISYKRYSNPNGPTFTIPISQVLSVKYQNGDNDVFSGRTSVYTKKKYRKLKGLYNTRDYEKVSGQPYSPFWNGFASFLIPGLGEIFEGEWGRGLCVVGANILMGSYTNKVGTQWLYDFDAWYNAQDPDNINYDTMPGIPGSYFLVGLARLALNIWSITDAVKIAKVKDMYWQDCMGYTSVSLSMDPYFAYTPVPGSGLQPVTGVSLKLTF